MAKNNVGRVLRSGGRRRSLLPAAEYVRRSLRVLDEAQAPDTDSDGGDLAVAAVSVGVAVHALVADGRACRADAGRSTGYGLWTPRALASRLVLSL